MLRPCPGKDKFGFWIDEFVNQPSRTGTIDLRSGRDNPGSTLIFLGSQASFSLRLSSIGFERFCRPEESLQLLATSAFEKVDIVYLLEPLVKLLQLVGECFRRRFPSSGVPNEKSQRLSDLFVLACSRFIEHRDQGGVRHAFDLFDTDKSRLASVVNDLFR